MKNFTIRFIILVLLFFVSMQSEAKKWIVTVSDYSFSPSNLTHVSARDTIVWQWEGGTHTTTSTTIPADALDWDYELDLYNQTQMYIPMVNGTYTYVCTLHPQMVGHFVFSGAGVPEAARPGASVTPNPFHDELTITVDPGFVLAGVKMFDLTGRLLMDRQINESGIFMLKDLPETAPGLYILSFITTDNRTFARRVTRN